jgi:branched-chain amino acid transport system permease protein
MKLERETLKKFFAGFVLFAAAGASCSFMNNYQLQVLATLAMVCTLCWAWNIVGGYMGYPSLASSTFFGVGAYVDAIAQGHGVPIGAAWLCAGGVGALFGLVIGAALLRLKGHYFAIGTVATVEVAREVANNWSDVTGGAVGINVPIPIGDPETVGRFFFMAMLGLAAISFLVTLLTDRSKFGFGLRCIRQNEQAASMVGVNALQYKVIAFVLSGALSAAAGGIYASMVAFLEPKDAFNILTTIEVPVMVMLGGVGTVFGPFIGGVFYVVLKEFVWNYYIDWHSGILGVIVVLVIYLMPRGVLGSRWTSRFTTKRLVRNHVQKEAN